MNEDISRTADVDGIMRENIKSTQLVVGIHAAIYGGVSVFLLVFDWLTNEDDSGQQRLNWSLWAVFGWGAGVLVHGLVSRGVVTALRSVQRQIAAAPENQPPIVLADTSD